MSSGIGTVACGLTLDAEPGEVVAKRRWLFSYGNLCNTSCMVKDALSQWESNVESLSQKPMPIVLINASLHFLELSQSEGLGEVSKALPVL